MFPGMLGVHLIFILIALNSFPKALQIIKDIKLLQSVLHMNTTAMCYGLSNSFD